MELVRLTRQTSAYLNIAPKKVCPALTIVCKSSYYRTV